MTTDGANYLTNFIAVFVGVALPRVVRIILRIFDNIKARQEEMATGHNHIQSYELRPHAPEAIGWHEVLGGFRDALPGTIQLGGAGQLDRPRKQRAILRIVAGFSWMFVYLGFFTASVLTAKLATNSHALSQSPECGVYRAKDPMSPDVDAISRPLEFSAQTDSVRWARNCYGNASDDSCALFVTQSIPYNVSNWTCPFVEHICYGNGINPVRFSTGPIDGRSIGINAPITYEFNRTTICTPLNMNRTYINLESHEGTDQSWAYYYGPTDVWLEKNATWISKRHNGIGEDASYLTK